MNNMTDKDFVLKIINNIGMDNFKRLDDILSNKCPKEIGFKKQYEFDCAAENCLECWKYATLKEEPAYKLGKDIMLEYCRNVSDSDTEHFLKCKEVAEALEKDDCDLYGYCPSSFGLEQYYGCCREPKVLFNTRFSTDQYEQCRFCWIVAMAKEFKVE